MIIGENYVFLSVPKNCTHTLYDILLKQFDGRRLPGRFHGRAVPADAADHLLFSVVRNPYSRAVSAWWSLTNRPRYAALWLPLIGSTDFRDFLRWRVSLESIPAIRGDVALLNQCDWFAGVQPAGRIPEQFAPLKPARLLRLESLTDDFAALPFVPEDFPAEDLPRLHPGKYGDWREIFTRCGSAYADDCRQLVHEWAGGDFTAFNYSLEG